MTKEDIQKIVRKAVWIAGHVSVGEQRISGPVAAAIVNAALISVHNTVNEVREALLKD